MASLTADGRILNVDLHGDVVRAAQGSMVAYTGNVDFKGAGMGGGDGFRAALKRKAAGESLQLMECSGSGRAYLAVDAQYVSVVDLANDTLSVESESVLAVTPGLKLDVKFAGLGGAMAGQGVATTTVTGTGQVALLSDGPMIRLEVVPGQPLVVDPQAFVASSGQLSTSIVSGVSWRSVVGEGSGEAFSMKFDGSGLVCIQPAER
ncbi:MAG TPA: AIM24 family protein [Mycobacteriales bacterium]|nr:AIM24 family protein [Mycobacteriales bacterium]